MMAGEPHDYRGAAARLRLIGTLLQQLVTVAMLVVVYYVVPVDETQQPRTLTVLLVGLLLVIVIAVWQVRSIVRSSHPLARGMQALATAIPLYLLVFAMTYYLMSAAAPNNFTERLGRTDALYFTVTVFATVGFGDIVPVSEPARVAVLVQMLGNLIVLGLLLRAVTRAVQISQSRAETSDLLASAHDGEESR